MPSTEPTYRPLVLRNHALEVDGVASKPAACGPRRLQCVYLGDAGIAASRILS